MKTRKPSGNPELLAKMAAIESDPENLNPKGSFYKFKPEARRKLLKISLDITANIAQARAERGDPVPTNGYSGRKTNRL